MVPDLTDIFRVTGPCVDLGLRAGAIVFDDLRIERSSPQLRTLIDEQAELFRARVPDAAVRALPEPAAA